MRSFYPFPPAEPETRVDQGHDVRRFGRYRRPERRIQEDLAERAPLSAAVRERDRHRRSAGIAGLAPMAAAGARVRPARTGAGGLED